MSTEIIVIFWVLCAITAAVIASGKNRNGVGWFFIGLLISIFCDNHDCLPASVEGNAKRGKSERNSF